MSDLEKQLTDPAFIADELSGVLSRGEEFVASILEKYEHGESFADEEKTAQAIIAKSNKVKNTEPVKQLTKMALQYENLVQSVSLLIARNNSRLLQLFQGRGQ
jgi:hypothetical protein